MDEDLNIVTLEEARALLPVMLHVALAHGDKTVTMSVPFATALLEAITPND